MQQIHAGVIIQRRAAADVPHSIAASVGSVAPLPSGSGFPLSRILLKQKSVRRVKRAVRAH
jgi:hypothetical protein